MSTSADNLLSILNRAAELEQAGKPFALATVTVSQRPTSARIGSKAIVTADGSIFGWVGGACSQPSVVRHALETLESGQARVIRLSPEASGVVRDGVVEMAMTCHSGGTLEIFIEPFLPEPYLIAVGDSPVSAAVLELGKPLGFRTVAMAAGSSEADEVYPEFAFERISSDRVSFVVVATMGADDETVLLSALALEPAYLALVGSRRRFEAVAGYLRSRGVSDERLRSIYSPAGLDIRAESPAEIALSILAQIIPIRRAAGYRLPVAADAPPSTVVIDPVCGMEVDLATAKFTLVVEGETLGFCCPACLRKYEREQGQAQRT